MVTAERLVATCAPAITAAGQGVVSRLCGFAAAATEVLGGGDWAVLVHPAEGVPPAVIARGGSPSGATVAVETLVVGFGEWTVQVGASPTAATGPVVVTTLAIAAVTVTAILLVDYTSMAGVIGGGGLGDLAIRFGYQRFQTDVMVVTVLMLIALVQLLQMSGDRLVRYVSRK